jgi:ABC-type dipeptide/oligopeptide/nickel transport system permease subunit
MNEAPGDKIEAKGEPPPQLATGKIQAQLLVEIWRVLKKDKTAFGGFFVILGLIAIAVLAPWIAPYDSSEQHIVHSFKGPSVKFWLGTDEFGRDLFSRIIWGTRPALLIGVLSVLVSIGIGVPVGVVAGYKMGWVDRAITWVVDIMLSFPSLLLGLMIVTLMGHGVYKVIFAIGFPHIAQYIRLARAPTMALRNHDFVRATQALGAGDLRIIFRHILPNILGPIIIMGTLSIAAAIRMEASLSFLGLGIQPPSPSWGNMIREGVANILQSPWMALFPGLILTLAVLAFNMVGDSLRDLFDPRVLLGRKIRRMGR